MYVCFCNIHDGIWQTVDARIDTTCILTDEVQVQTRHGAALALREVLRSQADAAGLVAPVVTEPTGTHCRTHLHLNLTAFSANMSLPAYTLECILSA